MKKIIIYLLFIIKTFDTYATPQVRDTLIYNDIITSLEIDWETPLMSYYSIKKEKYPFNATSYNCDRGHIATWEIKNDSLFLKSIWTEEKIYSPYNLGILSQKDSIEKNERQFAYWYTGIIKCYENKKITYPPTTTYYFHIENGVITDSLILSRKEVKKTWEISSKNKERNLKDTSFKEKYKKLETIQKYSNFYYEYKYVKDTTLIINNNP